MVRVWNVVNVYKVVFNNARSITSHGSYVQVISSLYREEETFRTFSRVLHDERRLDAKAVLLASRSDEKKLGTPRRTRTLGNRR